MKKIVYTKSCSNGMNPGDSEILEDSVADKIIESGVARQEPQPKKAKAVKPKVTTGVQDGRN